MPRRPPTENGRRNASSRRAPAPTHLHLLSIPLEVRENVFLYLVDDDSADGLLQLLQVNRQLFKEARPFLFKRPLVFEGQSELFAWLRCIDQDDLRHVTDVTFQLHDIKPDEIVGALGKRLRQVDGGRTNGPPGGSARDNPYHEACELEVKKIGQAFSVMPNVKRFCIIPWTEADPRPSHRMLIQFSRMLARCFPNLDTLLSRETSLPINFVSGKSRLRYLQIPSHCPSSLAEVASVFAALPVTKLAIYGGSACTSPSAPQTNVTAEALRAVDPLEELTLYESDVELLTQDVGHEVFIKSPDAIGGHLRTLRSLKILVEYTAEVPGARSTLNHIHRFLHLSQVERLEMAEPLIITLDHHLPPSIVTFVIRLDKPGRSDLDLSDRLDNLLGPFEHLTDMLKQPGECVLPNLEEVIILFECDEDEEEIEGSDELAQAEALFQGTDVALRWRIADHHPSL